MVLKRATAVAVGKSSVRNEDARLRIGVTRMMIGPQYKEGGQEIALAAVNPRQTSHLVNSKVAIEGF